MTWITGAIAFLASIATAFTGYLVQTNFDSQWIASEAKDGLNSFGAGAFFNVLDVGQMLLLHVMLLPLVVGVIVVVHVLLVRATASCRRSTSTSTAPRRARAARDDRASTTRTPADASGAAATVARADPASTTSSRSSSSPSWWSPCSPSCSPALFCSPDEKPITLQGWAPAAPADFVATATGELAGTSESAGYGAAVQRRTATGSRSVRSRPQKWAGVTHPGRPGAGLRGRARCAA